MAGKAIHDGCAGHLEEQAKKASLQKFDVYEGRWPFNEERPEAKRKRKPYTRHQKRNTDPAFAKRRRKRALASWEARKARRAA